MALELTKKIYQMPASAPLASWIFTVEFFAGIKSVKIVTVPDDISAIPIKVDLPSYDTQIVTQKFFGTEKSFVIGRKHGGDTTLEFNTYSVQKENEFIIKNFIKEWNGIFLNGDGSYARKEFNVIFDKISVSVYNRTDQKLYSYVFINCIPIKLEQGTLSYESEDKVKFTLSIHYDDWYVETIDTEE
jgi:hypothetical protein